MKRVEPRAMGRANVIRKRTCHITLVLSEEVIGGNFGSEDTSNRNIGSAL